MSESGSPPAPNAPPTEVPTAQNLRSILAVAVLFKRAPSQSETLNSLLRILNAEPRIAKFFSLILYDNSPHSHDRNLEADIPVDYRHDPANGGLAAAYNYALGCAEQAGSEWLLLLDQDTVLTSEFVEELVACAETLTSRQQPGSIVPKLFAGGGIVSPAAHFLDQMRHQFQRPNRHAVSRDCVGTQMRRLYAYNSGAMLRVSALRSIGGFPEEYWLDYLDHAVFHALSIRGYEMYVMHSVLQHDASQADFNGVPLWRHLNMLAAQTVFVREAGNFFDRILYRIWLLRCSRSFWIRYRDPRLWREAARLAIFGGQPKTPRSAVLPAGPG